MTDQPNTIAGLLVPLPEMGPKASYVIPGGRKVTISPDKLLAVPNTTYFIPNSFGKRLGVGSNSVYPAYRLMDNPDGTKVVVETNEVVKVINLDSKMQMPAFAYSDEEPTVKADEDSRNLYEAYWQFKAYEKLQTYPENNGRPDNYLKLPLGVSSDESETLYVITERVAGQPLDNINLANLPTTKLISLLQDYTEIAKRIHFLNTPPNAINHRDIKPGNFMYDGANGELALIDFDLAQTKQSTWGVIGTVEYSPVEQWSETDVMPSYDAYAMCSCLADLLVEGRKPFKRCQSSLIPSEIMQAAGALPPAETELTPAFQHDLTTILKRRDLYHGLPEEATKVKVINDLLATGLTKEPSFRFTNPVVPVKLVVDIINSLSTNDDAGAMATAIARYATDLDMDTVEIADLISKKDCQQYLVEFCEAAGINLDQNNLALSLASLKKPLISKQQYLSNLYN